MITYVQGSVKRTGIYDDVLTISGAGAEMNCLGAATYEKDMKRKL